MNALSAVGVATLIFSGLSVAGCGGPADEGEGDCTQALAFQDQTYLGHASSDLDVADRELGRGELVACADDGGADQEDSGETTVLVRSVDRHEVEDVVGVEIEGRLDLYFRDGMDSAEIEQLIKDLE